MTINPWIKAKNFQGKGAWKLCRVNTPDLQNEIMPLRIVRPDLIVDAAGKSYSYFDVEYFDETVFDAPNSKQIWSSLTSEKPNTEVFAVLNYEGEPLLGTLKPYPDYNNYIFFHQKDTYPVGEAKGETPLANAIWLKAVVSIANPEQLFTREQMITAFHEGTYAAEKYAANLSSFTAQEYMDLYFPL